MISNWPLLAFLGTSRSQFFSAKVYKLNILSIKHFPICGKVDSRMNWEE